MYETCTPDVVSNGMEAMDKLRWASDKATMHLEFLSAGIHTRYTLILPAYTVQPEIVLTSRDLDPLGVPFVIKPANTTGGSLGVENGTPGEANPGTCN